MERDNSRPKIDHFLNLGGESLLERAPSPGPKRMNSRTFVLQKLGFTTIITVLQTPNSQTPLMLSPPTQLHSHQQPASTCSQSKDCLGGRPSHSPTANSLTSISHERITAMPSMKSPPDKVGQVGWPLSPHDLQMHVGFQQTPKRRGQQTMGRLLPACSAFTNPPSSSELRN